VVVLLLIFIQGGLSLSSSVAKYTFWLLLFLFGIFWVTVVTNSFPMLWQMSTYETVGIYTGLYYFFSQLASIISPPIAGACIDRFGYRSLFIYGCVSMLVAFFLMAKVDKGEPEDANA
jgi:predicted MFS family arabinose efflux permease